MTHSSLRVYRKLPTPVRILVLGTLINNLGSMIAPFLTVVMVQKFGLSPIHAGKVVSAFMAGTLVSVLAGGWFTDRIGRRRTLLLSLFCGGSLALTLGCIRSVDVFLPFLFLFGFFTDLYRPASSSLLADHLTSQHRSAGYATIRVAMNLGFGCALAMGGLFMDLNWRLLFWFDGFTTLAFGVLTYRHIVDTVKMQIPSEPESDSRDLPPWKNKPFVLYAIVTAFLAVAFQCHMTVLPLTITVAGHYSNKTLGALLAVNGLLITVFEIGWVAALSRRRRLRVAAFGTALVGIGLGITGLWLHWAWFLVTVVIWTVGEGISFSFLLSFMTDLAPPHRRGQYLSINQACWRGFMALGPMILLPLYAHLPVRFFWFIIPVILLPAVLLLLHLDRTYDRPERLIGAS